MCGIDHGVVAMSKLQGGPDLSPLRPGFSRGGVLPPGAECQVLVIPYAKRHDPLPTDWDHRFIVRGDECMINREMRCVRPDHPH